MPSVFFFCVFVWCLEGSALKLYDIVVIGMQLWVDVLGQCPSGTINLKIWQTFVYIRRQLAGQKQTEPATATGECLSFLPYLNKLLQCQCLTVFVHCLHTKNNVLRKAGSFCLNSVRVVAWRSQHLLILCRNHFWHLKWTASIYVEDG